MAVNAVPSLSSEGWITAVDKKCDRLLMNAFASDASQSNIFKGNVCSIQAIIYEAGQDMTAVGVNVASALERMFGRHFDTATFTATVTPYDDKSGRHKLFIEGKVVQNQRRYDFGRVLESVNGMISKFMTESGTVLWTNQTLGL